MESSKRIKSDILETFCREFPDIVSRMRSTLHSYSADRPNIYHLEDDVWSHTLLVLNCISLFGFTFDEKLCLVFSALLHDIGKVFTRKCEDGKTKFHGHSFASTLPAYEILLKFKKSFCDFDRSLYYILNIVSNHDVYYNINKSEDICSIVNYDYKLLKLIKEFVHADFYGRFTNVFDDKHKDDIFNLFRQIKLEKEYKYSYPDVWVYAGIPGSGKDYISNSLEPNKEIISFDNIRLKLLGEIDSRFNHKEKYELAYRKSLKYDILAEFDKELKDKDITKLSICNTNISSKNRKSIVNILKNRFGNDLNVGCRVILNTINNCVQNDLYREDKTVTDKVVYKMSNVFSIPTMKDGFSYVELIQNNFKLRSGWDKYADKIECG